MTLSAAEQVRSHFETQAEHYLEHHAGVDPGSSELLSSYVELLDPYLHGLAGSGPALDVGCGPGTFTAEVQRRSELAIIGVDLSESMIGIARREFPELTFEQADAIKLPFATDHFSLTYSFRTLQHIPDFAAVLRELARVAAPGGVVVFDYVNRWHPLGWLREKCSNRGDMIYLRSWSPRQIRQQVAAAGLRLESVTPIQMFLDRANLKKHFGRPPFRTLGWLLRHAEDALGKSGWLRPWALRQLVVARK